MSHDGVVEKNATGGDLAAVLYCREAFEYVGYKITLKYSHPQMVVPETGCKSPSSGALVCRCVIVKLAPDASFF